MRTSEASKNGSRVKRIAGVLGVPTRSDLGEGRVGIATLDTCDVRTPRGQRGRHVRTEWEQKPGTTRGSPRRSRTAKASRISRPAVKSRCAGEWGGWGRLSEDGPGQHNPDPSEGPWGGGRPTLQGGASSGQRPGSVRDNRSDAEVHEGRRQTGRQQVYAGSRLKPLTSGKAPPDRPAFQPYWGNPAVRNERGDRGNVGIIRSPVRASILPDCGGRSRPAARRRPHGCRLWQRYAAAHRRHRARAQLHRRDPVQHLGLGAGPCALAAQALVGPGTTPQADAPG